MKNEKKFTEKKHALKERETIQAQSSKLVTTGTKACRIVPELKICKDTQLEANIQKLAAGIHEEKVEVARV